MHYSKKKNLKKEELKKKKDQNQKIFTFITKNNVLISLELSVRFTIVWGLY